jgi:iron complex outermembrane receptor protein
MVGNSLRQPDTQDPLGLTKAEKDQNPRQATPNALLFNTKKSVAQDQAGGTLAHRLGDGRIEAMLYAGQRNVEQFLAIPVNIQNGPNHSGGIVNLDRDYGGGALRYFHAFSSVKLAAGVERDTMYERRKGYINNNGVIGILKRDEQNTVASTDYYAQAEWKLAERWALHGGLRHSHVHFNSTDYYTVTNGDDSGSRSIRRPRRWRDLSSVRRIRPACTETSGAASRRRLSSSSPTATAAAGSTSISRRAAAVMPSSG